MSTKFLIGILGLSFIIGIHEVGHYVFARMCKVGVEIFSIGFGPVLWSRTDSRGTKWQICAIPLGGFVYPKDEEGKSFGLKYKEAGPIRGCLVAFAGPLFNFLTAIACLAGIAMFFGTARPSTIIDQVEKNSPAFVANFSKGDKILSIDGKIIEKPQDFIANLENSTVTLERGGKKIEVLVKKPVSAQFGVNFKTEFDGTKLTLLPALKEATLSVCESIKIFSTKIWGALISCKITGPIGIVASAANAHEQGPLAFILFIAAISVAVGATNLLPIPIVDGGRIIMFLVSWIIRRPVPEKVETVLNYGSLVIIAAIFAIGFFVDIKGLIQK